MKTYIITKKPEILNWDAISTLNIDVCLWNSPGQVEAKAQLCYDEAAIYVKLSTKEAHIRAEEVGDYGTPCLDSCLEFFFCPMENSNTYINIEFNPNGCLFMGIGNDRYDLIRLVPVEENPLSAESKRTKDSWEITYRIPADFIRRFFPAFELSSGVMLRGNFYKCGDETVQPHYYSWNPITQEKPDFHLPAFFGKLCLE